MQNKTSVLFGKTPPEGPKAKQPADEVYVLLLMRPNNIPIALM